MLSPHDLSLVSQIGHALWQDPDVAEQCTKETLAAVSLLELTPDRTLERTCSSLLERGRQFTQARLDQGFFRLTAEQRLALVGMHHGRWSYDRLARVLKKTKRELEELLWKARLELLISVPPNSSGTKPYPSGPSAQVGCPEYDPNRPWTQRFLDEEFSTPGERFSFQSHLEECTSCRDALGRYRETYYKVQEQIRGSMNYPDFAPALQKYLKKGVDQKFRTELDFYDSLILFFRRPDILAVLGLTVVTLLWQIVKLL